MIGALLTFIVTALLFGGFAIYMSLPTDKRW